eukprot:s376_g6.t1
MLDNALLRDPDRGLAHFKDTLRPYFVKGVSHVFLWRFLQLFRTYRGQNEFVHWIGRFEIAQKCLLASWSGLLDLSDLPEVGTADFTAALTAAQQAEMANLPNEDAQRCKRYKKPDAAIPAKKTEKKSEKKPLTKGVKKPIPADEPLDVPSKPSIFSDSEEFPPDPPMVASGPSSGHKDPEPAAPEPQPEVKSEVTPEAKVEVKVEDKKEPMPKGTLSLALQRIHEKLQSPTELLKLHLKHYHMSTEQFKRRTSALKLPKEIYEKYDAITKSCDTCSKSKIAPSRAKVSGIRSEVFGELTFIDHGEVPINAHSKLQFLLLCLIEKRLKQSERAKARSDARKQLLQESSSDTSSTSGSSESSSESDNA